MTKRTDIHRPSAIVPGEYNYVMSYDLGGPDEPPFGMKELGELEKSQKFAARGTAGQCTVCSTHYRYGDVWVHIPSGEHIHIGQTCAGKYGMMADRSVFELELGRHKAAAAREIQKALNAKERDAFLAKHPGLAEALQVDHRIIRDIADKFMTYRTLSDKQIAFVFKLAAEKNAPPKEAEKMAVAPVEGRKTFTGLVVATKCHETAFGTSYKMTLKVNTPEGPFLLWGTIPANVLEEVPADKLGRVANLRGATVSVTATLSPTDKTHMSFMKRPKGSLVALTPEVQAVKDELIKMGIMGSGA